MPDPIRVILVDDQSLVRSGFRMLIESEDDMEVVSEASNGLEALDVPVSYTHLTLPTIYSV